MERDFMENYIEQIDTMSVESEIDVIMNILEYEIKCTELNIYMEGPIGAIVIDKHAPESVRKGTDTKHATRDGSRVRFDMDTGSPKNLNPNYRPDNTEFENMLDSGNFDTSSIGTFQRVLDWCSRLISKIKILINTSIIKNGYNKIVKAFSNGGKQYAYLNFSKFMRNGINKTANTTKKVLVNSETFGQLERYLKTGDLSEAVSEKILSVTKNAIDIDGMAKAFSKMATDPEFLGQLKFNDLEEDMPANIEIIKKYVMNIGGVATIFGNLSEIFSDPKSILNGLIEKMQNKAGTLLDFYNYPFEYNWSVNYQKELASFKEMEKRMVAAIKNEGIRKPSISKFHVDKNFGKSKNGNDFVIGIELPKLSKTIQTKKLNQLVLSVGVNNIETVLKRSYKKHMQWNGKFEDAEKRYAKESQSKELTDLTSENLTKFKKYVKANYTQYTHYLTYVMKVFANITKIVASIVKLFTSTISITNNEKPDVFTISTSKIKTVVTMGKMAQKMMKSTNSSDEDSENDN